MPPVDEVTETVVEELSPEALAEKEKFEQEEEAAFLAESDEAPKEKVIDEAVKTVDEKVEEKKDETPPQVIEPAQAKITDAQWQEVLNLAKSGSGAGVELRAAIEKTRGDAFGKIGGLERTLRQIQEATPVGHAITVTGDDLKEFKGEFPELADKFARDLTNVLSKFKGTGAPVQQAAALPEDFDDRMKTSARSIAVEEREKLKVELALETLNELHEDWQTVTGPANSATPYRQWLKQQPEAYQNKVLASNNAVVIGKSITAFKEFASAKEKPKTAAELRAERLKESVVPKGGSHPPVQSKMLTEEDGFNSVKFDS